MTNESSTSIVQVPNVAIVKSMPSDDNILFLLEFDDDGCVAADFLNTSRFPYRTKTPIPVNKYEKVDKSLTIHFTWGWFGKEVHLNRHLFILVHPLWVWMLLRHWNWQSIEGGLNPILPSVTLTTHVRVMSSTYHHLSTLMFCLCCPSVNGCF